MGKARKKVGNIRKKGGVVAERDYLYIKLWSHSGNASPKTRFQENIGMGLKPIIVSEDYCNVLIKMISNSSSVYCTVIMPFQL